MVGGEAEVMEEAMSSGDMVIGLLAAAGIVVLVVVFFWVVRMVFFEKKDKSDV